MVGFNMKTVLFSIVVAVVTLFTMGILGSIIPPIANIGLFGVNSVGQVLTVAIGVWLGVMAATSRTLNLKMN